MLNMTTSGTQHSTRPFASSVTPSTSSDRDFNFCNPYGNFYLTDVINENSTIEDLFPEDFYSGSSLTHHEGERPKVKLSNSFEESSSLDCEQVTSADGSLPAVETRVNNSVKDASPSSSSLSSSSSSSSSSYAKLCDDSGCGSQVNGNSIERHNRSSEVIKHSNTVEMMYPNSVDINSEVEKKKAAVGSSPSSDNRCFGRGKGRPVKSAQGLTGGAGKSVIQCFVCNKTFNNSSALAKHKLIHSDDRKYSCSICTKSFKRQDHLHGHMMTHSAKKPYECCFAHCDKSYCDARSLRRHHENHHLQLLENNQREFPLATGNGTVFDSSAFKPEANHWTIGFNPLEEPKPVKCLVCGKGFRNLPALNGHMRLHGGYTKQIKSEPSEAVDSFNDKDDSETAEASSTTLLSEDSTEHTNVKNGTSTPSPDSTIVPLLPAVSSIKQEFPYELQWMGNKKWYNNMERQFPILPITDPATVQCQGSQNNKLGSGQVFPAMDQNQFNSVTSTRDISCVSNNGSVVPSSGSCFYPQRHAAFQNDEFGLGFSKNISSANHHPCLSSPCVAATPPPTPNCSKLSYAHAPLQSHKSYRRAITPSYVFNNQSSFMLNKHQHSLQQQQHSNSNLHRTTSAVFSQGHSQSPFATTKNYTPISARTTNIFQFPPSYEDVLPLSPNANPHQMNYTQQQFPPTSPFLSAQSRPRTPFTPSTPGRSSCRQQQIYFNHGEDSPMTPNMRNYGHKTPSYHPYHHGYRYHQQHKQHPTVSTMMTLDSELNQCLDMLAKENLDSRTPNPTKVIAMPMVERSKETFPPNSSQFSNGLDHSDNLMECASAGNLATCEMDFSCLVAETEFCNPMNAGGGISEWPVMMSTGQLANNNSGHYDPTVSQLQSSCGENLPRFPAYDGHSFGSEQTMKTSIGKHPINSSAQRAVNNNSQIMGSNEPASHSSFNNFGYSTNGTYLHPQQQQEDIFINSSMDASSVGLHRRINSMTEDPMTSNGEKRKKKHKPEPLWIPANVSNFANNGGCFIEKSDPKEATCKGSTTKPRPPPYDCITPSSAVSNHHQNLYDANGAVLPNSAPPFHDFSLNQSGFKSPHLNGF